MSAAAGGTDLQAYFYKLTQDFLNKYYVQLNKPRFLDQQGEQPNTDRQQGLWEFYNENSSFSSVQAPTEVYKGVEIVQNNNNFFPPGFQFQPELDSLICQVLDGTIVMAVVHGTAREPPFDPLGGLPYVHVFILNWLNDTKAIVTNETFRTL